ncbi:MULTISPECIES: helix-turn-helix domain-containing protein [Pasteurellaceae]|uniref:Helix-turn-helix transcriptional regulator n=1 Tax=Pasteurella atlantica TaxID=2827233 RepID=A0AAW8CT35_9PAST|nr:helix-turn-helix transcriptional regulator [Pasteurella atlantica]MBR0573369.1 helix-turn-helix transcriptional regulator [Pasteurella atlantica]MDP8039823.1 helix-turn-helix transcriptional regulator [Pasteurella atlantica]MDP8041840.1 helix-turn-helix transcriptional regulator [Pasteurella atlantica]MDP8043907.1 helix-turn-helix transcriptional regulator [Pasteurella atlantica]MDP8046090.1 helix-turn-helix transcriptional regulator [Pasteurella atlantica]
MYFDRLKNERLKLGFKQEEFGILCGVTKNSQFNYEKGTRLPNIEYLQKAEKLGVDINYVITGTPSMNTLDNEEAFLLDKFRQLASEQKTTVLTFLIGGVDSLGKPEKVTQNVTADNSKNINASAGDMTVNKNFSDKVTISDLNDPYEDDF